MSSLTKPKRIYPARPMSPNQTELLERLRLAGSEGLVLSPDFHDPLRARLRGLEQRGLAVRVERPGEPTRFVVAESEATP